MHENMYVHEQGENHFLLGFVCPTFLYAQVTCACTKSMSVCHSPLSFICITHVYVFLCAFMYVPVCDAGNCTWVYLWSEPMCMCVYMHLFHLLDLMSLLEVCKYVSVCSCVPCSAGGHPSYLSMYLLLPTSHESASSSPWGEVLCFKR